MAEGDRITGRAYFAGGHPARGARIRVLTADGERLTTLTPDSDGAFGYQAKAARDLRIVAESADGHRAEWRIAASELAGAFGTSDSIGRAGAQSGGGAGGRVGDQAGGWAENPPEGRAGGQIFKAGRPALDAGRCAKPEQLDPAVVAAIEKAVARQVRPLREALAQSQARAQLQDVLGGIGYILGVAGLGIWWTVRQKRRAQASGEPR
jgi:nickel transport protein